MALTREELEAAGGVDTSGTKSAMTEAEKILAGLAKKHVERIDAQTTEITDLKAQLAEKDKRIWELEACPKHCPELKDAREALEKIADMSNDCGGGMGQGCCGCIADAIGVAQAELDKEK